MSMGAIVSRENLRGQNLARRKLQLELMAKNPKVANNRESMIAVASMMESLETGIIPQARFAPNTNLVKEIRKVAGGRDGVVAEFIGSNAFAAQWYERQRYEVDAGREDEPVTTDESLPKNVTIYTLGDAGVVFEEVHEGGEVKFASLNSGSKALTLHHYAVALQYSQELFEFNELFRLGTLERQFGVAYNALLNHYHMSPILDYAYAADNQTDGGALTSFAATATMPEKYLRTLEAAITTASADNRRGPYALIVNTGDQFVVERALARVAQQGFDVQSSAMSRIQTIVAYDGWTGTRGNKTITYDGVDAGKAYLVNLGYRQMDFQSFFKYPLRRQMGESDMSRFILAETIWDTWFGAFADPSRAVEEITWPESDDGTS
jgi:hypothetical protein